MDARRIYPLRNPLQHYAWGSRTAIPELIGAASPAAEPVAELWMGAHPSAPSQVVTEHGDVPLDEWLSRDPESILGPRTAARSQGRLPYLVKILAAERALSIQAHPDLDQARAGFARENAAGIPLDAPQRCYKDDNHKPELICALTPFRAMNRFRQLDRIVSAFEELAAPELEAPLAELRARPDRDGLAVFFRVLLTQRADAVRRIVDRAVRHAGKHAAGDGAWRLLEQLGSVYPGDVGVLAPLLLNVVDLAPGEGMYLPAGELHSYVSGTGIEIMASSDNVLRGGLTPKHVDVPELLHTLRFTVGDVERLAAQRVGPVERRYVTPAAEFALSILETDRASGYRSETQRSAEILLCVRGSGRISDPDRGETRPFARGDSLLVPACVPHYEIRGDASVYRASVPG